MTNFFRRLERYGIRKAFALILVRFVNSLRVVLYRLVFSDNSPKIYDVKIHLPTQFLGNGCIELSGCQLGVWPSPYFLNGSGYLEARAKTAKIHIGHGTAINNNFVVIADKSSITIGENCLIGPNLFIVDSDFHGIEVLDRRGNDYGFGSISIGDDVFIGAGVKILKNVTIGDGVVVAGGSVVVDSLEAFCVYGGIPAKKIGSLKNA